MFTKLKIKMSDANLIEAIVFTLLGIVIIVFEAIYNTGYVLGLKYSLAAMLIVLPLSIYFGFKKSITFIRN